MKPRQKEEKRLSVVNRESVKADLQQQCDRIKMTEKIEIFSILYSFLLLRG